VNHAVYEFGDFVLDVGQQRLLPLAGGEGLALTGKTFELLVYLLEHADEALDRETLLKALWPNVVVEENSLTQVISGLRSILRETPGEHRYIVTLPRKGYRFVARVSVRSAVPGSSKRNAVPWITGIAVLLVAVFAFFWTEREAPREWQKSVAFALGSRADTTSAEAFALFASGRFAYLRLTEPSLLQAIGFFERAVALDPRYARAYAGIADANVLLSVLGARSPDVVFPVARAAAEHAVALNPNLAAAHVSLGQIKMVHDRDLDGAAREFERALELDPGYAPTYFYRGSLSGMRGDVAGALAAFDRAVQLEPYTLSIRAGRALALFHARRYDESIDSLRQILSLDDRFDLARGFLMRALLAKGEYAQVLSQMKGRTLHGPGSFGFVGQALALSGRREEARAELARVLDLSRRQHVPAYDIAMIYAALDDPDNTFMWLDRALEDASPLGTIPLEPLFDKLHGDPRFERLVSRIRGGGANFDVRRDERA
jgi:DNA-binding winged helix-turn-helix (wHTH) protein/Flp pilus assembly protein TadD